jgi:serine/threonine protein kinase
MRVFFMSKSKTQNRFSRLSPGARIDDFTIAHRIAEGMNTDVFAVWHHRLQTPLICKRLRPADEYNEKWRTLLQQEAAALARLHHPGIVRLLEYHNHQPLPYLLLEYVGEETLRHRLHRQQRLAADEAVRLVQHIGAAVSYAHAQGYLHRDLKPSNIIQRNGYPVLIDFGVVWKWRTRRRPPDRCGTPSYLAPEQIRQEALTPATDIYGLGVLLFELLTGQRPFRTGNQEADYDDLTARYPQLVEDPISLAEAGLPHAERLEKVVRKCLARAPQERFASVQELLMALDRFTPIKVWPQQVARRVTGFQPFC